MLRPIGDRVIIRPRQNPTQTESGLLLSEHRKPEMVGTVMAVGPCEHPDRSRAVELADWLDDQGDGHIEAATILRRATAGTPQVKVGDTVAFSWQVGQELWLDDERYLMMKESDILAVLEETNG